MLKCIIIAAALAASTIAQAQENPVTAIESIRVASSKATHAEALFTGTAKAFPISYPAGMVQWTVNLLLPLGPVNHANADKMADLYAEAINTYPAIKDKLCAAMNDGVAHWNAKHS